MFYSFEANSNLGLKSEINFFCFNNYFVEIERSKPAVTTTKKGIKIVVTSELRPMTKDEIKCCERRKKESLKISLEDLNLSYRSYSCLKRAGYETLEDIVNSTFEDFSRVRHFGMKSYIEVMEKAMEYGLTIKDED